MAASPPHGLCRSCATVFSLPVDYLDGAVVCPSCGREDAPAGVMRPSGVPDLTTFRRNYARAHGLGADEDR